MADDPLRIYINARQQLIAAKARMDKLVSQLGLIDIALSGRARGNGTAAPPGFWKRLSTVVDGHEREICEGDAPGRAANGSLAAIRRDDWPSFDLVWEALSEWQMALGEALEAWSRLSEEDRSAVSSPQSV